MPKRTSRHSLTMQKGYALLSSLILLFLLTAIALGMAYSSLSERTSATSDMQHNRSYYGAEAAMEKMTADLGTLYQNEKSPTIADIQGITAAANEPNVDGVTFADYSMPPITPDPNNPNFPATVISNITSGSNQGLYAQVVRLTLSATAQAAGTQNANGLVEGMEQVKLSRNVEVALIPVFQFGVFCQNDCDFFNGPTMDFNGRTFANGNVFLATGSSLTFHTKVQAVQQIVRNALENGVNSSTNWTGTVDIPTQSGGCDGSSPPHCRADQVSEESTDNFFLAGGVPNPNPTPNPNWVNVSGNTYDDILQNSATGVKPLNLSFVAPGVTPYEIIRRPFLGESPTSSIGSSRLYNQAQIRILLDDNPANLPRGQQPGDRQLDSYPNSPSGPAAGAAGPGLTPMAQGVQLQTLNGTGCVDAKNNAIPCSGWDTAWVNLNATTANAQPLNAPWPLISGWLRVEYRDVGGNYHNVTQEWLNLGFARQAQASGPTPDSEAGVANTVDPNAILLFQYPNDPSRYTATQPQYGWYPINMYDPREGEVRDSAKGADCAVGGLMSLIELDMGNLKKWLTGAIPGSGAGVESSSQNGYVVYFSDRRGMVADPFLNPPQLDGEYGFDDVINPADPNGAPNGVQDAGENVDQDKLGLRNYGAATIGVGFGLPPAASQNPYTGPGRIASCSTTGRVNKVTGPRHGLRLVNGSVGNLAQTPAGTGGTTVASENPVYVLGDYNAAPNFPANGEVGAAVIADAVTMLSNSYTDLRGLLNPTNLNPRTASTTWYRMAVAAGKNLAFPLAGVAGTVGNDFGTDGGIHNFLRYIENWGGQTLNYQGSLVSFYYARQAVGVYKCCNVVYSPPSRNYSFDTNFLNPSLLPPGTPRFQDIDNLSYHQVLTAR